MNVTGSSYALAPDANEPSPLEHIAKTTIEISIQCKGLPDCDILTKSDPQVYVYRGDPIQKDKFYEIGRTEVINDDLNPRFARKFHMEYLFEQIQRLRFEVYDIDPVGGNDFLGRCDTTLADIIATRGCQFDKILTDGPNPKRPGRILIEAEELITCKQVVKFTMRAKDLPTRCCGLLYPSPSIHIYRSSESGSYTVVHRSPPAIRSVCPVFKPFSIKVGTLCNGDYNRCLRFEMVDQRFMNHRIIGSLETTLNQLKSNSGGESMHEFRDSHDHPTCHVLMNDFQIIQEASFLDYIKAGTQMHFVVAVDFTASNGAPSDPSSLHYLDPMMSAKNPYQMALEAVGNIIKPYDTTGMYAGFGFGAKLNGPNKPPTHLFPLNNNVQHPYVTSIEELINFYKARVNDVIFSGPTCFAPCIQHCHNIARKFEDGNHYFVLLIVTDGIISDLQQTKRAIIEASSAPLSIIICGVGDADFTAMNELDSDDVVMRVDGKAAQRDVVQFVPMNQFLPRNVSNMKRQSPNFWQESQVLLAQEVLQEIPEQLTGYMVSKNFHSELTHVS